MAADTMEYVQHNLFYLRLSFSSNSFLSLLNSYKKSHQSQQLALQSSFPEFMTVLSVMTTSMSEQSEELSPGEFLGTTLPGFAHQFYSCYYECFALHLCFTSPSFYFLIFIYMMYYCQVIHMKMVKIGFKNLLLLLLLPSCNFSYLLWTS